MGVNAALLELLETRCRRSEPGSALVAGYPDMLVSETDMHRIMGTSAFPRDPAAVDIMRTHGATEAYDATAVFDALGYKLNVIDIKDSRGNETIRDLNYPANLGSYDLVLDHGTSEHVFNIGEAGMSLARAVGPNGFLVMHLPLAFMAHGFYNLNPEWYLALCRHSGLEVLFMAAWNAKDGYLPINVRHRFPNPPDRTLLSMVAVRKREGSQGYPIQDLYA